MFCVRKIPFTICKRNCMLICMLGPPAASAAAETVAAKPITSEHVAAEPIAAKPVAAEPVAEPNPSQPSRSRSRMHRGQMHHGQSRPVEDEQGQGGHCARGRGHRPAATAAVYISDGQIKRRRRRWVRWQRQLHVRMCWRTLNLCEGRCLEPGSE